MIKSKKIILSAVALVIIGFAIYSYFHFVNRSNSEPTRQDKEIR